MMSCQSCILRVIKISVVLALIVPLIHVWLVNKSYIFSEEDVASVTKKYLGNFYHIEIFIINIGLQESLFFFFNSKSQRSIS